MEIRDIAVLFVIAAGVIALKGFYDLFVTLPIWVFFLVIFLFLAFSGVGLFLLVGKEVGHVDTNVNFKVRLSLISFEPKKALSDAAMFWINWPGWVGALVFWKLFEPWTAWIAKSSVNGFGLSSGGNAALYETAISAFSLIFTYVGLVFITALFLFIHPISLKGKRVGECPRCGAKHSLADNYCSNCGAILPKRR